MDRLESLVKISQYYGVNPAYEIAGGGNTSLKNSEKLFIKASGISLATIDRDGFVVMSREQLSQMEDKIYSENAIEREEEVKEDLKNAIISPEHLRPSVETSLHNLIRYSYIIHTHPTTFNALMCANDAKIEVEERFGSEALYVEYTDPGYILFKILRDQIRDYRSQYKAEPKIIFLQNHGIFVGANTAQEIKAIYDSIESRIRERRDLSLPDIKMEAYKSDAASQVSEYFAPRGLVSKAFRSSLVDHFSASQSQYQKISKPFTPDIIVYCKSNYLFLEEGIEANEIPLKLKAFEDDHGYFPKVIIEEKGGMILVEENEKAVRTVQEVFSDMMKISYLSEQYGGPHFMTDEQISFIDNWEVENYRRSVAKAG
jgi:rhamnose utilization protein RhaD (predicted bifunctional aldolase and dehydrogenase)